MKAQYFLIPVCCFTLMFIATAVSNTSEVEQKGQLLSDVQYTFLAQRWLTKEELSQFENVHGVVLAVRLRLSNEGKRHILYLATSGTVVPTGYHLFRPVGTLTWQSTSPARGREGPPGSELTGVAYSWLELPPGGVVEIEAHDWSNPGEEHAFSTFVKTDVDAKPVEVISSIYRPLLK